MAVLVKLAVDGDDALLRAGSIRVSHALDAHGTLVASFLARSREALDHAQLLGRAVEVAVGETTIFRGTIMSCRLSWTGGADATVGSLEAVTASARLHAERRWRGFEDADARTVLREVWPDAVFDTGAGGGAYAHVLQRGETDWELVLRLCDREGWFVATHGEEPTIAGSFPSSADVTLQTQENLDRYEVEARIVPAGSRGHHHDVSAATWEEVEAEGGFPDTLDSPSDVVATAERATQSAGISAGFPDLQQVHHPTSGDLRTAIEAEQARAGVRLAGGAGTSREPKLAPGGTVEIKGTGKADGLAGVVSVEHRFDAAGGGYWNEFVTTYAATWASPGAAPRARASGITTGLVRDNHDPDGLGRLRVSFGWQGSERTEWIRRATIYAGAGKGVYLAPEVGEEVVVAFEDGDLERPIVLGAVWNGGEQTDAESRSSGNDVKSFVSRAGHRIHVFETEGSERIQVLTPESLCTVILTNEGGAAIEVKTKGKIDVIAEEGDITVTANQANIQVTAVKGDIGVEASDGRLTVHAAKDIRITSDATISIAAEQGSISMSAESMDVRATKDINVSSQTASGSFDRLLEAQSSGDLTLQASSKVKLKGGMVDVNGQ